ISCVLIVSVAPALMKQTLRQVVVNTVFIQYKICVFFINLDLFQAVVIFLSEVAVKVHINIFGREAQLNQHCQQSICPKMITIKMTHCTILVYKYATKVFHAASEKN